jgi:methionine--tRNA ligase beta chain
MAEITFPDFEKLEMRVAQITRVERIPGKDKLYALQIDAGTSEPVTVVSGLVPYYTEAALLERKVIWLANLKPATFGGVVSHGMLLCAYDEGRDTCVLLSPERNVENGTGVA